MLPAVDWHVLEAGGLNLPACNLLHCFEEKASQGDWPEAFSLGVVGLPYFWDHHHLSFSPAFWCVAYSVTGIVDLPEYLDG